MKSRAIHIAKISLRLRGVSPDQARQRAGSIAGDLAQAVGRAASQMKSQKTEIPRLSVRLKNSRGESDMAEQIRRQLAGD
jgi:hypothetical protein